MLRGPRAKLPPTILQSCSSAEAAMPRAKPRIQSSSAFGSVSATVQKPGSAPIAARSETATPNARHPIRSADAAAGKCVSATSESIVLTSSVPTGTRVTAASSPGPTDTIGPVVVSPSSFRSNSISANSFIRRNFGGARDARDLVEYTVDVTVTLLAAERARERNVLVDHDFERNIGATRELVRTEPEQRELHLIQRLELAIEQRRDQRVEHLAFA